jgi:hypothetical protein
MVLLAAGLMVVCACGGNERQAEEPAAGAVAGAREVTEVNGCDLLTKEEAAAFLGSPVKDGEEQGLAGCSWTAESGAQIRLGLFAGSMLTSETCNGQRFLVSGREEEIPGLGDSALWGSSGALVVCTTKAVLKINVEDTPQSPDEDRETAIKVARAALGRL